MENQKNSKEKIMNVAIELFSENGYNSTSIRNIAKEAEISLGLMYNYFEGKDHLLREIFQRGLSDVQRTFEDYSKFPTGLHPLELVTRQMLYALRAKKTFWRLMHSIRMQQPILDMMGSEIDSIKNYIIQRIEQIMRDRRMPSPTGNALLFYSTLDGVASQYLVDDSYPLEQVMELLIRSYQEKMP